LGHPSGILVETKEIKFSLQSIVFFFVWAAIAARKFRKKTKKNKKKVDFSLNDRIPILTGKGLICLRVGW
jgi:hypothetical protein